MNYELRYKSQFKKDLKLLKRRSKQDFEKLKKFIIKLAETGIEGIDKKHKPHKLIGNYKDCFECHVGNDLLLIWIEETNPKTIYLVRTGSHSDLF